MKGRFPAVHLGTGLVGTDIDCLHDLALDALLGQPAPFCHPAHQPTYCRVHARIAAVLFGLQHGDLLQQLDNHRLKLCYLLIFGQGKKLCKIRSQTLYRKAAHKA